MRLIDADGLEERKIIIPLGNVICGRRCGKTRELIVENYQKGWNDAIDSIINNAPTVELFCSYLSDGEVRQPCVEGPCEDERPQGKWIEDNGDLRCPFCKVLRDSIHGNFCSNCGADMRKGGAE